MKDTNLLHKKCEDYIVGAFRIGKNRAAVEIINKLIIKYQIIFGVEAYQILQLKDGSIISIISATEEKDKIRIYGYITIIENDEVYFHDLCCIETVYTSNYLQSSMIKMLYCIKASI